MTKEGNKKIIKKIFIFMTIVMLIFLFGIFINYFAITSKTNLSDTKLTHAITSSSFQILDQNNQEIDISNTSQIAKIDSIKQHTIDAFLTSEDRNFYSHKGIDYKRLIGALLKNIKSGKLKQGGSTISQQLIKNTHLSSEKTLERKMKEFKLTKQLEKNYSKNQIIELYLNTIYFGNGNYGIEEASQSYFGKSAKNLSIAESAMLAGIISAPSYNEPVSHHATAEKKKNIILKNMQKLGKINEIQYKNAKNEQIVIKNNNNTSINQFIKSVISNASKILNISKNNKGDDEVIDNIIDNINSDAAKDVEDNVSSSDSSSSDETSADDTSSNASSSNSSSNSSSDSSSSGISFTQEPDDNDWYPHM